jgi:hypothetical protein
MMNWKNVAVVQSRYCLGICLERLRKTTKLSARVVLAET